MQDMTVAVQVAMMIAGNWALRCLRVDEQQTLAMRGGPSEVPHGLKIVTTASCMV
jgi:hypothetical protein